MNLFYAIVLVLLSISAVLLIYFLYLLIRNEDKWEINKKWCSEGVDKE